MFAWLAAATAALAAGCAAVGPDYRPPALELPATFREADGWTLARPADDAPTGPWWQRYGDARLGSRYRGQTDPTASRYHADFDRTRVTRP